MRNKVVFGMVMFVLSVGLAVAMPQAKSEKTATHQIAGIVKSMNTNDLVVSHKVGNKEQDVSLVVNPETKREGDLKVGSHVTAHYKMLDGKNVVTAIRASKN